MSGQARTKHAPVPPPTKKHFCQVWPHMKVRTSVFCSGNGGRAGASMYESHVRELGDAQGATLRTGALDIFGEFGSVYVFFTCVSLLIL